VRGALVLIALVLLTACGEAASTDLAVLPASALPELSSSTDDVTADDLAADFGAGTKPFSGFAQGRERVFQGESHDLDRVVSRTLEFDDAAAAQAYLRYYQSHLALAYGAGTSASPIESEVEVNGGGAKRDRLESLLAEAP
jgi:hypothetical protein